MKVGFLIWDDQLGRKEQQPPDEATSPPSFVNFVIGGHQKGFPVDRLTLHFVDLKFSNFSWPNSESRSALARSDELWESQKSFS